jgi:hypothetical protein
MKNLQDLFPVALGILGALVGVLSSERVRQILRDIFRRPTTRSVAITIDGKTTVYNNISAAEQKRLADEFLAKHGGAPDKAVPQDEQGGRDD